MTNSDRNLHGDAYREWRDEATDEFVAAQRKAFMAGFEAAAEEGREFRLLREWLEERRDEAQERYNETDNREHLVRRHTFIEVLTKLSEMGCFAEEGGDGE